MAKSSAFASAIQHVQSGIGLLSSSHWQDQYSLSLNLYNAAAELAYCTGRHERVDKIVSEVRRLNRSVNSSLEFVRPLTLNLENPSVETALDLAPLVKHEREISYALSNSFGFGGTNASLVFGRAPEV